ncbi:MAG TPA: DUF5715 family protein [Longimicrobium sp.]|nr:DUF5715 family protein [Longimicrobium sp.]
MMKVRQSIAAAVALTALAAVPARAGVPVSLRGSPESMQRQNAIAKENHLAFVRDRDQLAELEVEGELVPLEGNDHYDVSKGVSAPVARPEVRTFVERLAPQYHEGCGERLVVTSLTRPESTQPSNAHPLSVHPAGMAVDLRISRKADCRRWLEETLLSLEEQGVLDITREVTPPHYHVALFPEAYMAYVARIDKPKAEYEEVADAPAAKALLPAQSAAAKPVAAPAAGGFGEAGGLWALLVAFPAALLAYALDRRRVRRG